MKNKIQNKHFFVVFIVLIIFMALINSVNAADINQTDEISLNIENDELSIIESNNLSISEDSLIAESDTVLYIGTEGSSTGSGTRDDPYDSIKTALNHVSGKTEIIYLAGTYQGNDNGYQVKISQNDIFIHADEGAEVVMDWGDVSLGKWTFTGNNCAVDGITFTNTLPSQYSYSIRPIVATDINNFNVTNCNIIIKGGSSSPISVSGSSNVLIENCSIKHPYDESVYYNSINIQNSDNIVINNNTIDSFKSFNDGGCIYISNSVSGDNIIIENNTFTNLGQYFGCGIYYNGKGTNPLTVRNNYFCNATSTGSGAFIYYSGSVSNAKVSIENNEFINYTMSKGSNPYGPIYLSNYQTDSELIFNNNTFINSSLKSSTNYGGGAIYSSMKKNIINDNVFINCSANNGGAIYINGIVSLNNNSFTNCSARLSGGAIYFISYTSVTLNDTIFVNCSAGEYGGAIYSNYNYNTIGNSTFINNNASKGGAIYLSNVYNYNITDTLFKNNSADYGGAFYSYGTGSNSKETMTNTTFEANNAKFGGAIYLSYSYNSTYSNNTFLSNNATIGGAIYLENAENYYTKPKRILIENSTFENNTAYSGGAVVTYMRNSIIANSTFKNNNASHYSGGALISDGRNITILNNTFFNNSAMLYAGAIGVNNSYVANNTFINNTAYQGGAVLTINSTIAYNKFADNNATRGKDVVYIDTYEYYTTTVKCNCTNCTNCDCTMDNCSCTNASMVEVTDDLLVENILDEDAVYKYDEKEILRVVSQQNGKYYLYANPKISYGDYYYWGYCIEQNNSVPLSINGTDGIHVDDLTFVRNSLDQSYVGDYLKVLLIMYQDEIYNLKDYVYAFTDGDYLNSDDEIIKNVINVTNDEFTYLENGNNYVNGSFSCYWFSTFIMPTSRQNLILINSCAPIKLAGISVLKDSNSDFYSPNSDIEYEISAYNSNTNITLHNVTITDVLSGSGWYIKGWNNIYDDLWVRTGENSWTLNRPLLPGEGSAITVVCHVNSLYSSYITNTANIFSHETGTVSVSKEVPIKPSTPTPSSSVKITKTSVHSPIVVGDTMVYKVVVTNDGTKRSGKITVKDTLSDSYYLYGWYSDVGSWGCDSSNPRTFTLISNGGCLDPGESASFYLHFRTPYFGSDSYTHSNIADVYEDGSQKGRSSASTTILKPKYHIVKTASEDTVAVDDSVTFTIVVYYDNFAGYPLTDITVQDVIPSGFEFISYQGNGWSRTYSYQNRHDFTYYFSLSSTQSSPLNIICKAKNVGNYTNVAVANAKVNNVPLESVRDSVNVSVVNPSVYLMKTAPAEEYHVGDRVPFTITVRNTYTQSLSNVVVHDLFHNGLVYDSFEDSSNMWIKEDGITSWKYNGYLSNGSSSSFIVYFNATESGTLHNVVTVTTNQGANNESIANVEVLENSIIAKKLVIDKIINKGSNVTFVINVKNNYNQPLTNIFVNELPEDGLTFLAWKKIKGDWEYDDVNKQFKLNYLAVDDDASFNITFRGDELGYLYNVIEYGSQQTQTFTTLNNTFVQNPSMEISKITLNDLVVLGEKVGFKIQVKNNGNVPLGHVFINETTFEGLNFTGWENSTRLWKLSENDGKYRFLLIGNLAVDETATLIVYFNTTGVGKLTNIIIGGSDKTDNYEVNNTTFVEKIALKIEKIALTPFVNIYENATFAINVTNIGETTLTDVVVREMQHEGLQYLTYGSIKGDWEYIDGVFKLNSQLIPGDWACFNITFNATREGRLDNIVQATYNKTRNVTAKNNTIIIHSNMTLEKLTLNKTVYKGENVTFTIVVTNNGFVDLGDVVVEEIEHEGLTDPRFIPNVGRWAYEGGVYKLLDVLEVGESASFNITFTATDSGKLTNVVQAKSNVTHEILANNNTFVKDPNLTLTKVTLNKVVDMGDMVTFQIIVNNTGNIDLSDVMVNETLHEGLESPRVISIVGRWVYEDGIYKLLDVLNVGKSASFNITFISTGYGNLTNIVTAKSNETDEVEANNTTFVKRPELSIHKLTLNKTVYTGDNVTFTIIVYNNGNIDLSNVVICEEEFEGLEYLTYFNGTDKWSYNLIDNKPVFKLLGNLAVGKNASFNVVFKTSSPGSLTNMISGKSDNTTEKTAQNTTEVLPKADLSITKDTSNKTAHLGDLITWTIVVTNNGHDTAQNVKVIESIPVGLIYQKITPSKGTYNNITNTWDIGELSNGEKVTLTITTKVIFTNINLTNVATVTSSTYDYNMSNNVANNTTKVSPEADLGVIKLICNSTSLPNGKVIWSVVVTNFGPDMAENVIVTDLLPKELQFITSKASKGSYVDGVWNVGNLANKETATLVIYTRINKTSGNLTNYVNVESDTYDSDNSNNIANNTTTVLGIADLVISKSVSNTTAHIGDVITWTIVVTNNGPSDALNAKVTEDIPSGLEYVASVASKGSFDNITNTWTIGKLANGESVILKITTIVVKSDVNLTNVAEVKSSNYDNDTSNNVANNTTEVSPEADLGVIKLICNSTSLPNGKVIWSVVVTNFGPDMAENVVVTDLLPEELQFITSKASKGSYVDGVWNVGNLANKETATLVIYTRINKTSGNLTNYVNVESDTYDSDNSNNIANNTTTVKETADLSITKLVSNKTSANGDEITWTIIVTNNGPGTAYNVKVTDILPEGLIFVSSSGNYKNNIWTIGELAKGASVSLNIISRVNISGINITNVATVSSDTPDSNKSNNVANNTTEVLPEPDLSIVKVVSNNYVRTDDEITWTIVVVNYGNADADNVTVIDSLPEGLTYSHYVASNGVYNYTSGIWNIPILKAHELATLIITTKVSNVKKNITNVAILGLSSDNDTVEVNNEVKLKIVKTVSDKNPNFGDVINWTITVFNFGPAVAKDVNVTDILPEGLIFVSSNGNYTNGIWHIGDLLDGENKTLIITTLVNTTSNIINTACVVTTSENVGNDTSSNSSISVKYCDLVVVKSPDSNEYYVGELITWTIIVTNNGPDVAKDVTALDILPKELQYVSYAATKGTYDYQSGLWIIGNLAKGESVLLTIKTIVLSTGNITNSVVVSTSTYDANESNNFDNATVAVLDKTPSPDNSSAPAEKDNRSEIIQINENATGNPFMALIAMLFMIGTVIFKRRK